MNLRTHSNFYHRIHSSLDALTSPTTLLLHTSLPDFLCGAEMASLYHVQFYIVHRVIGRTEQRRDNPNFFPLLTGVHKYTVYPLIGWIRWRISTFRVTTDRVNAVNAESVCKRARHYYRASHMHKTNTQPYCGEVKDREDDDGNT